MAREANDDVLSDAIQAVIFDVDGTLYDQGKMRRFMLRELLLRLLKNPLFIYDIKALYVFRKRRESLSEKRDNGQTLESRQYAEVASELGISVERIRSLVSEWIHEKPLPYLPSCRYPGVKELFSALKDKGIRIGIFSDYPCRDKLQALGLDADVDAMVFSTERRVDRFKPHPKGLLLTAQNLEVPVTRCLYIGDRDDKDGECARRAGMSYLVFSHSFGSPAAWYRKQNAWKNSQPSERGVIDPSISP